MQRVCPAGWHAGCLQGGEDVTPRAARGQGQGMLMFLLLFHSQLYPELQQQMESREIREADTARRVMWFRQCSFPGTELLLQVVLKLEKTKKFRSRI